jgi:hypothetical protein
MEIKVGGKYRNRAGEIREIIMERPPYRKYTHGDQLNRWYDKNGKFMADGRETKFDLISEVTNDGN